MRTWTPEPLKFQITSFEFISPTLQTLLALLVRRVGEFMASFSCVPLSSQVNTLNIRLHKNDTLNGEVSVPYYVGPQSQYSFLNPVVFHFIIQLYT